MKLRNKRLVILLLALVFGMTLGVTSDAYAVEDASTDFSIKLDLSGISFDEVSSETPEDTLYYAANKVQGTKTKLTSGKTYYFKVRAYKKTDHGTVYSSWSDVKNIKIK